MRIESPTDIGLLQSRFSGLAVIQAEDSGCLTYDHAI